MPRLRRTTATAAAASFVLAVLAVLAAPAGPATAQADGPPQGTTHVVQRGETLSGIAAAYGARVEDLAAANHLADPGRLATGLPLTIPAGTPGPTTTAPTPPEQGRVPAAAQPEPTQDTVAPQRPGLARGEEPRRRSRAIAWLPVLALVVLSGLLVAGIRIGRAPRSDPGPTRPQPPKVRLVSPPPPPNPPSAALAGPRAPTPAPPAAGEGATADAGSARRTPEVPRRPAAGATHPLSGCRPLPGVVRCELDPVGLVEAAEVWWQADSGGASLPRGTSVLISVDPSGRLVAAANPEGA